jgi:hypothetical protein
MPNSMPNIFWPQALSPQVGGAGLIGRAIHWIGVLLAGAFLITALGFAVDGWSRTEAAELTVFAIVLALCARGARYLLARE